MRMRQSLAELEQAFFEEVDLDRERREHLRQSTVRRAQTRHRRRRNRRGSMRFALLVLSLIATAVGVTVAMFETLYLVAG